MSTNIFLLLDTATPVCSVALSKGEEVIYTKYETNPEGGHAARLGVLVEEALQHLRVEGLSLSAVGISAGPGSYTGLRIASSLAKGICHGLDIPLIAVSTLQMMADGYRSLHPELRDTDILAPMIDARRQEVYTARFNNEGLRLGQDEAKIISGTSYYDEAMQSGSLCYHFFGDGVHKPEGISQGTYQCELDFIPQAEALRFAVNRAFEAKDFVDTAYWKPNYLKEYVAQISKNKVLA